MNQQIIRTAACLLVATLGLAAHAAKPPAVSDAQFTLLCQTFTGTAHAQAARQTKESLIKGTKLKDWYVVTSETESNLYYGFYRTYDNPKDADTGRAQSDRKTVAALADQAGNKPFHYCVFVPIAGTDPEAPAEWDLKNAKGYFSLAIAAYMDSPMRKQYAVDAVKAARAQGVEAYYYHGEHVSEVCIGAWEREAVREQESAGGKTSDSNQPLLVTTTPLPNVKDLRTKDTGEKVKVLQPKVEFLNPSLIKAKQDYPNHSINGETSIRRQTIDGKEVETEDRSFLVLIPAKEEVVKQDPTIQQRAVELGVTPSQSSTPKPGAGKLKSFDQ